MFSQSAGCSSQAAAESDAATRRQTQTDNDASGNPQRVAGRPVGRPLRMPLRGESRNAPGWGFVGVATWATRHRTCVELLYKMKLAENYY